ncbi:BTAD domain-containing putative transcriptional regulator [Streptomyces sp. NPDC051576]|uniref:BTAD domain-containing putative transcriptional regulator n=1 Tax=Streptomyces sp. NPDC051576 TaxID=3155803 RepID=UPI003419EBCB
MYSQDARSRAEGPNAGGQKRIRFHVLGPLSVRGEDGRTVPVPGTKQRAVLGFFLLNPNQVVATSRLVDTLWPGRKPATARKMVQNSVSALRTVLAQGNGPADEVVLLTHAPGYLLRVDPDLVDLHRVRRLAEQGRREMDAGSPATAAELFRQVLAQWHGTVLADLVEAGVSWPELAAMADERQAVREDRVDAELRCGRHQQILGELRLLAEAEPMNERLCALLMTALYRSGKQAEALEAYRRQRAVIAERFGSEPTQELRDLERAVLTHDPVLDLTVPSAPARSQPAAAATPPAPAPPAPALVTEVPPSSPDPAPAPAAGPDAVPDREGAPETGRHPGAGERKRLSAVLVRVEPPTPGPCDDAEAFDSHFREMSAVVAMEAARYGGTVAGQIGSTLLMLFGLFRSRVDDALRAVRAAHAVRDRLLRHPRPGGPSSVPLQVRVAVSTGDALVRSAEPGSAAAPTVVGALLDRCLRQLESAEPGHIRLCEATRRSAELLTGSLGDALRPLPVTGAAGTSGRRPHAPGATAPLVEREGELAVLTALFNQAVRTGRPHQITLLGEPGVGKSRLAEEFGRAVRARAEDAHVLHLRISVFGRTTGLATLGELVGLCADVQPSDSPATVDEKLAAALRRWLGPDAEARAAVLRHLRVLVTRPRSFDTTAAEAIAACRSVLEALASRKPLLLVVDDLHLADDSVLHFIDGLAESPARAPLLVVTTARPDLIERRPHWGGGGYRTSSTMNLEPLSATATALLVTRLWERWGVMRRNAATDPAAVTGGNPLFVTEYAALFRPTESGVHASPPDPLTGQLPERVRAVVTEHIDALHPQAKAVLRDASVQGTRLWPAAVAAVGRREVAESERWLAHLERRHFLVRAARSSVPGSAEYVFRSAWVREVARLSVLQPARQEGRRRADAWLAERTPLHR